MQLHASWIVTGVVTAKRVLTSEKSKSWRGYVIKVASLGATFELQADEQQFGKIAEGETLEFRGLFEDQSGRLRLMIGSHGKPSPAAKVAA